jgi:hypothetical protein
MSASDFDSELEDLWKRSAGRLMAAEVFDAAAFSDLLSHLREKAEAIKAEHVVSKQVLHCILWTVKAIEGARSLPRDAMPLRDDLYVLLDLIAVGEAPSDRSQGSTASDDPSVESGEWSPA